MMYGLETLRGGAHYIDMIAQRYESYACADWKSFDQTVPWIIIDEYFTKFLPRLIVINHGYQPTAEWTDYSGLTTPAMFMRMFNIITFLRNWLFNTAFCLADGFAYTRTVAGILSGMLETQYIDGYANKYALLHSLFHFGCTLEQIKEILAYVLGDDDVIFTHWDLTTLDEFISFMESHCQKFFGMVLSRDKTIITRLRNKIEFLGYKCSYGHPTRDLDKLLAQLCYPEHGPIDKYMSNRCVGIAYAAAGNDPLFHQFCKDLYHTFLPYTVLNTPSNLDKVVKHLPGILKMLDDPLRYINITSFPSIEEVRAEYATWKGELSYSPKWDIAHFMTPPGITPPDSITMAQYMLENNITFPSVRKLI
jgi:hypothetical protein